MIGQYKHLTEGCLRDRQWSIIRGALRNNIDEIKSALAEDPESINDQDERSGVTALHIAAADGNLNLVRFLISQPGCDALIVDHDCRPPNYMASAIGRFDISDEINAYMIRCAGLPPVDETYLVEDQLASESESHKNVISFKPRGP